MNATIENFANLLSRLGITLQSSSGIATSKDDWECIQFNCRLSRNGKPFWNGPYSMGLGHVKLPASLSFRVSDEQHSLFLTLKSKPNAKVKPEYMQAKLGLYQELATRQKLAPTLPDVMYSLLFDGSAFFDGESFDSWCSNFGYDTDSRKAEATWKACVETGMALRRSLSAEEVRELQEASQDM